MCDMKLNTSSQKAWKMACELFGIIIIQENSFSYRLKNHKTQWPTLNRFPYESELESYRGRLLDRELSFSSTIFILVDICPKASDGFITGQPLRLTALWRQMSKV